jgi:hypothetical protein
MTKEVYQAFVDMAANIGLGAVGALVVLLIGNRLRCSFDAALKRKRFRSYLTLLRRRIEASAYTDFLFSPEQRDIPKLEAEILEVRHCIPKRLINRFDAAIATYKTVRFDGYSGTDEARHEAADTKNEKSKDTLIGSLDELFACARWMA